MLTPLSDRVLVEWQDSATTTASGLIIPEAAKEKPNIATVVAVGPGKCDDKGNTRPMQVKVGDTVMLPKYSGTEVKIDGRNCVIVREDDILGVVFGPGDQSPPVGVGG
jgi:chaperonin GroES